MKEDALHKFRSSAGWEAGIDGSIVIADVGAGGSLDSTNLSEPIIAFAFGNKGLMFNFTLEGAKYSRMNK